jgi:amidase
MTSTASGIANAVRAGELRPTDVVGACLDRIARLDPEIGAFRVVRAERARAEAADLEARPDLADLPLAGVPVAVKDTSRSPASSCATAPPAPTTPSARRTIRSPSGCARPARSSSA